jgi:hypothetical protein
MPHLARRGARSRDSAAASFAEVAINCHRAISL